MVATAPTTAEVKQKALGLGFDLAGVCEAEPPPHLEVYERWLQKGYHGSMEYLRSQLPLRQEPQQLLPGARSIIAVGLNYNRPNPRTSGGGRISKYALGRDYHKVLRSRLRALGVWLDLVAPGEQHRPCVDSAPIFERDFANLAGLGWFGKNTMLINSHRGSWFFIGLLLTTLELDPDRKARGGCGTCTRCIDACPTGALVHEDGRWQLDARRCISYLTIEHKGELTEEQSRMIGDWTFGCDICQEVCPFNEVRESQPLRAAHTHEPDFLQDRAWPSLAELAEIDRPTWDQLTRGSAIRRAGFEGLKRNARINLLNSKG